LRRTVAESRSGTVNDRSYSSGKHGVRNSSGLVLSQRRAVEHCGRGTISLMTADLSDSPSDFAPAHFTILSARDRLAFRQPGYRERSLHCAARVLSASAEMASVVDFFSNARWLNDADEHQGSA